MINFNGFVLKDIEVEDLAKMIQAGYPDRAIEMLISSKVKLPARKFTKKIQQLLFKVQERILKPAEMTIIRRQLAISSISFQSVQKKNMSIFARLMAKFSFKQNKITNPDIKKAILENTLERFNSLTRDSMRRTTTEILNLTRNMQREMIIQNRIVNHKDFAGQVRESNRLFRANLKKKLPSFYLALEDGKILKSKNGDIWSLDKYLDMATETTLMNIDRDSVETTSKIEGSPFVIYYQFNNRKLKTKERAICQHVLSKRIDGHSLVALTLAASKKLKIPLLDNVRSKGGLGVHCRHSIKQPSQKMIDKLMK